MNSRSHFAWIDVLRGLSALAIVLFHVRVTLWVGWAAIHATPEKFSSLDRALAFLSLPVPFFGSAVMLFFLVSGFCIHYPYANAGRAFEWKSYLWRRLGRIYPPYLAAVVLGILIECYLQYGLNLKSSSPLTWWKSIFMLHNYGVNAGTMVSNPSLWSLPVELELYLVYPLFLFLLHRHGLKRALLLPALVSFSALILALKRPEWTMIQHNFAIYWLMWCAGAACAELIARRQLPPWRNEFWGAMGLLLLVSFWLTATKQSMALQNWSWAGFYFLILLRGLMLSQKTIDANATANADATNANAALNIAEKSKVSLPASTAARIGVFSYSLYLIHYPFFTLCGALWVHHFGSKPANIIVALGFCIVSVFLSKLFYSLVEAPAHRLSRRYSHTSPKGYIHPAALDSLENSS